MSYGEKRQRQKFKVKYTVYYPTGKKWTEEREIYAYSELGVRDYIKWLKSIKNDDDLFIWHITGTHQFGGPAIYPDNHCIGDR